MNSRISIGRPRIATTDTRRVKPEPKVRGEIYGSPQFVEWRKSVLKRANGHCQNPACPDPLRKTRLFADHIHELRDGGAVFDLANGWALCGACHSRKTLHERARMGLL